MGIAVTERPWEDFCPLHELYRQEANCQLIRDSFWARGLVDAYAIELDGQFAGYGAVANRYDKGRLLEFYTFPAFRRSALRLCQELLFLTGATHMEAQTNVPLMLTMLHECAIDIRAEKVLFADVVTSRLTCPQHAMFRHKRESGELPIFEHCHEPEGNWLVEIGGEIVATGGFLSHYNPPYADLFMEVAESQRLRGFGSYLVQELKRACYESGKR